MKPGVDITISTLHLGNCRRVVTLGINGKDQAQGFLLKLHKDDYRKWRALYARITSISEYERYENQITFRNVGDGIFEFKRPGLRLYAFYDELDEEEHLILCTNGGTKNTKKQQNSDIQRARSIRTRYLEAKAQPDTHLTIQPES